jgi:hypothetical protein
LKDSIMHRRFVWLAPAALVSAGLLALSVRATPSAIFPDDDKPRTDVATCLKIDGALLQRGKDGTFKALKSGDHIAPHTLLVGFPQAELVSSCGRVKIHLHLYLGENLPVSEAAIVFNDSPQLNADVTIDRGVVGLQGVGDKGDIAIRVRGPDSQVWELTLKDPDSHVFVARFGRHEAGTKLFKSGAKKAFVDEPMQHLGLLVVKGKVVVNTGTTTYTLQAPPGPALITWDSGVGYHVKQLDKWPAR